MPKEAVVTKFHTTIDPVREDIDVSLDDLTDAERAQVEAEVAEMHRREAAGEQVGH